MDLLDVATGTSAIERLLRLAVDLLDVVAETSAIERLLRLAVELLDVVKGTLVIRRRDGTWDSETASGEKGKWMMRKAHKE